MDKHQKKIAVVLKNIRGNSSLTMRQLAMLMGVSHTFISHVEHGRVPINRHRQEQWVKYCHGSIEDFDKMIGYQANLVNFRDESVAILNGMTEESLEIAFKILSALSSNSKISNEASKQTA